jgi:hypothetical protein
LAGCAHSAEPAFYQLQTWRERFMNRIIWIVGVVVIVLAILGYFGLR